MIDRRERIKPNIEDTLRKNFPGKAFKIACLRIRKTDVRLSVENNLIRAFDVRRSLALHS